MKASWIRLLKRAKGGRVKNDIGVRIYFYGVRESECRSVMIELRNMAVCVHVCRYGDVCLCVCMAHGKEIMSCTMYELCLNCVMLH